jgi:hypothetical protein
VISNSTVNEINAGLNNNYYTLDPLAGWGTSGDRRPPGTAQILVGVTSGAEIPGGTPLLSFAGYTVGSPGNNPQRTGEHNYQGRDDLTTAYHLGGRHDVKIGADITLYKMAQGWCNGCDGHYTSTAKPPANLPSLIPNYLDASTWNLNAMSPLFRDYAVAIGNMSYAVHRQIYATWYQDDWKISNKLTANLGVRYDLDHGAQGETVQFLPWLSGRRPTDKNNVAPRLGFAYDVNDKTVIRGGWGLFFTELEDDALHQSYILTQQINVDIPNNGRADFGSNPWGGPTPTYQQLLAQRCDLVGLPFAAHDTSYSQMVSFGLQRQFGGNASLDSDFAFTGGRAEERRENVNLEYNPATGENYPYTDVAHNPFPSWGPVAAELMVGRSNLYAWENTFTKRMSHHWQLNATYTLSYFYDDGGIAGPSAPYNVTVNTANAITTSISPVSGPLAPGLGALYQLTPTDQRHRATVNGIWDMGKGFQLSGLYFFGSGQRYATSWGSDLLNTGGASYNLLTPAGTTAASLGALCNCTVKGSEYNGQFFLDRAQFVGKPIHRIDARLQKRISLGGKRSIDGLIEVFNVFNHANYGSYVTTFSNAAAYGQPSFNPATAYQPRIIQLGFHMAF